MIGSGCKFTIDTEIEDFYLLNRIDSRSCVLEFLFVKPPFIGKNIGGQLIEHAIKSCRTNSCKVLSVLSDPNAVAFYEKYGFKTISLKESSVPDRFLPEMELEFLEKR
ncbi:dTDP-fucosamine acetyltransferase [Polaribacter huanghezhanensis]|uniref:GNAT family N-acetyltransferase n=1 Tax=Polaribacter huanghezhanensis TaxID=1354726 RepID=UPI0026485B6F|nr:GNAT family N-acetyltransferase [Polaribacter huanghezhanensis]WKD85893.1 dTDP-fucosamine acetyltransferase [Polaribacter huanghezhanensis]